MLKVELMPRVHNLFQKTAQVGILASSFYGAIITKTRDITQKIKLQADISHEWRCEIP